MWPILCAVHLKPVSVFPITLTCGGAKPQDLQFLEDMVMDVNNLLSSGLQHRNKTTRFNILFFVCDAAAKAFVKNVKLCTGYYGCDRCVQRGEWYQKVTYQDTEVVARSDDSFRQQTQGEHHHGSTPLLDLPINMIGAFPIDYMHQACLGVMKRLLFMWCRGVKSLKISATQIEEVSSRLTNLRSHIPSSFARKPRDLKELERLKATEYRQFMLYTGKIVLKRVLKDEFFGHFMAFSVAMNILVSPALVEQHWKMYRILEFLGEKTVSIVASNWITKEGDKTCSYWPLNNHTQRAKEKVLPDPKTWLKRPIRIFSTTDDWDQAIRRNRRAETNSCVETGKEGNRRRIITEPPSPRPSSSKYTSPWPSPQHSPQQLTSHPVTDDGDSIPSSTEPPWPILTGDCKVAGGEGG
ncbi:hypothetical protein GJAV_G00079030 [Gymnothorax javanicus]|nr:hypothetical protein GJAV_G00079030 [Gymnothorax javanicus]